MEEFTLPDSAVLLVSDGFGIYIPQIFCERHNLEMIVGVDWEDWQNCLDGPDNPHYWESWETILDNATVLDETGTNWYLYQDQDLWGINCNG